MSHGGRGHKQEGLPRMRISLKKVKLADYFSIIVGRDNATNLKPHPDHLIHICKQLNVKTDEILVIGDNIRDIEAAINVELIL